MAGAFSVAGATLKVKDCFTWEKYKLCLFLKEIGKFG